jgi:phosphotransferase system HPr-like phosphotransfer protein
MNEILSSTVVVQNRFSFRNMLEIHQVVKKVSGTIFLSSKQKVVDAASLPKLVSFLLTIDPKTNLKIIIEGTNIKPHLLQLTKMLANETSLKKYSRAFIESSDTF